MNETPRGSSRLRLILIIGAVVVVLAGAVTAGVLVGRSDGTRSSAPPAVATSASTPPRTAPSTTTAPGPAPGTPPPDAATIAGLPLWPFAGRADALAWQDAFRAGGHQPWHLDATATALSFTRDYLGYADVDKAIGVMTARRAAWVTVGFDDPNGRAVPAAVLHLVRFGSGADAPWEVVGSRDTTLTLTTPAYGVTVRSPVTVGGLITGVDESLRAEVRTLARSAPLGAVGGVPAGGENTPWRITLPCTLPAGHGVLTVAVATGGHIAAVERFAITGVRY